MTIRPFCGLQPVLEAAKCGSCWATMRATMKRMLLVRTAAADPAAPLAAAVVAGGEADELATARFEKLPISGTSASSGRRSAQLRP